MGQIRGGWVRSVVLAVLLVTATGAQADDCDSQLWQGQAPQLINPRLQAQTQRVCKPGFVLLHSGVTRTALWSAEYLTRARLQAARKLDRQGVFFEENSLPAGVRGLLEDYKGSGFDRGHLAPNGDMGSRMQQAASFSLANMVPQNPTLNRGSWNEMEQAVRALVLQEGEAYVITGPAFLGSRLQRAGQVLVPTQLWKAVYFPRRQAVGVYVAANDASNAVEVIALAELEAQIGMRLFPGLSDAIRTQRVDMPLSTAGRTGSPRPVPSPASPAPDWWGMIEELLRGILKLRP